MKLKEVIEILAAYDQEKDFKTKINLKTLKNASVFMEETDTTVYLNIDTF